MKIRTIVLALVIAMPVNAQSNASDKSRAKRSEPTAQAESAFQKPLSRAEFLNYINSEFTDRDTDKDGRINPNELEQFEKKVALEKHRNSLLMRFKALDKDGNGVLYPDEFLAIAPPADPDVDGILISFDQNRDKVITIIEYRLKFLKEFDRQDADKDGFVTAAERNADAARREEQKARGR